MSDTRPNPHGLGARIRAARRAHGFTQDQLARAVGVTRSAVAQWETDRAGQIGGNLTRVARALGTTTEYLLTGQELPGAAPLPSQADEMGLLRAIATARPRIGPCCCELPCASPAPPKMTQRCRWRSPTHLRISNERQYPSARQCRTATSVALVQIRLPLLPGPLPVESIKTGTWHSFRSHIQHRLI